MTKARLEESIALMKANLEMAQEREDIDKKVEELAIEIGSKESYDDKYWEAHNDVFIKQIDKLLERAKIKK